MLNMDSILHIMRIANYIYAGVFFGIFLFGAFFTAKYKTREQQFAFANKYLRGPIIFVFSIREKNKQRRQRRIQRRSN
ncbi:hypothetical protein [Butyrivibrio sp. FCS014]|uniref:hypothetical protein n=1 Tax=Butyrivibrio sp. FCS014 TaxID=1408304 RepID=UPI000465298B|nr:hypothetical protein [Butyrivibrio sp. FCS014]